MKKTKLMAIGLAVACAVTIAVAGMAGDEDAKIVEKAVAWKDVPAAVQKTMLAEAEDHEIKLVEEVRGDGPVYFETNWIDGEWEVEINVAPDGTLMLLAREKPEAEDEDADRANNDQDND